MTRGGKRQGAGRPRLAKENKAKQVSFWLYSWEVVKVRQYIKTIRQNQIIEGEV